jgi:hypothetical protein
MFIFPAILSELLTWNKWGSKVALIKNNRPLMIHNVRGLYLLIAIEFSIGEFMN